MGNENITMKKEDLVLAINEVVSAKTEVLEKEIADLKSKSVEAEIKSPFVAPKEVKEIAESKSKMVNFIKGLYRGDSLDTMQKAGLTEGTGSNGGFLVPQEFAAEVNRVVEDFGLVAKYARKITMNRQTMYLPRLGSSVSVYYPGESVAGTVSLPVFQQVTLTAKSCIGLCTIGNEVLEDANVSIVDLLVELFAEAIAGQIDLGGLVGANGFTGVLQDSGVNVVLPATGNSTFTLASTPDNLRDMISAVKTWALQGAGYVMHRSVWGVIQKLKASGSGEYFVGTANPLMNAIANSAQGQSYLANSVGTIWGYPVFLSDKMPAITATAVSTKFIIFGNLKNIYLGLREEMEVAISNSATIGSDNTFAQNMSAVRVVARHAIAVGLPAALSALSTSAS